LACIMRTECTVFMRMIHNTKSKEDVGLMPPHLPVFTDTAAFHFLKNTAKVV